MTRLSRAVYLLGRWYLAVVGILAVVQGVAYLPGIAPEPLPGVLQLFADAGISPTFWALAWIAVGLLCWAGIPGRRVSWSIMAVAAFYAWGLVYLVSFGRSVDEPGPLNRDWFNARTYLGLGALATLLLRLYIVALRALWKEPTDAGGD